MLLSTKTSNQARQRGHTLSTCISPYLCPWVPCSSPPAPLILILSRLSGSAVTEQTIYFFVLCVCVKANFTLPPVIIFVSQLLTKEFSDDKCPWRMPNGFRPKDSTLVGEGCHIGPKVRQDKTSVCVYCRVCFFVCVAALLNLCLLLLCCFLTLTDPLRIQPWSQDRRNQTKSNRESEISMDSRQKRTDKEVASKGRRRDKIVS